MLDTMKWITKHCQNISLNLLTVQKGNGNSYVITKAKCSVTLSVSFKPQESLSLMPL